MLIHPNDTLSVNLSVTENKHVLKEEEEVQGNVAMEELQVLRLPCLQEHL